MTIRLDDYVLVNANSTLREIIRAVAAIAGDVGETRPLTDTDLADITGQAMEWIRETQPVCGAVHPVPDTVPDRTPPFEFTCSLPGFHKGHEHSTSDGSVVWTSPRALGEGHLAPHRP